MQRRSHCPEHRFEVEESYFDHSVEKLRGKFLSLVLRDRKGKPMRDSMMQCDALASAEFAIEFCIFYSSKRTLYSHFSLRAWAQKPLHRVLVKLIFDCCGEWENKVGPPC